MRKGNLILTFASLSVCLAVLVVSCAQPVGPPPTEKTTPEAPAPQVFKWRMQSPEPMGSIGPGVIDPLFSERVREMSDGRLQITPYAAGELVPSIEITDALAKDVVQMGRSFGAYYAEQIPVAFLDITCLPPYIINSYQETINLYEYSDILDIMREGHAEAGIHYLTWLPCPDGGAFWSREPMYTLEDLKGFKLRSYGQVAATLQRLGATPIFLPHEEVYTALATGVLDGSGTGAISFEMYKYYEVCKYFYRPVLHPVSGGSLLVSMNAWNSLPSDLKAILSMAAMAMARDWYMMQWEGLIFMYQKFPEWGVTIITWSESDVEKVREIAWGIMHEEIATKSDRCAEGVKIIEDLVTR